MNSLLITGASGFLGEVLHGQLRHNFLITTCGGNEKNTIICDLSLSIPQIDYCDYILHASGKAHTIPKNTKEAQEFFDVNYLGTINLVKALENNTELPKAFVFISSVAVYGLEEGEEIDESYLLKGNTPYALSKIKAEEFLLKWGIKNDVKIGILRLPLIVGKNPQGNLGAMIKGIKSGKYLRIGKGQSKKSMVLAQDVAKIIPEVLKNGGIYNLTDGDHPSFSELENVIAARYHKKIHTIPKWLAHLIALPGDVFRFWPINSAKLNKITSSLTFSDVKARQELGWSPQSVAKEFSKVL